MSGLDLLPKPVDERYTSTSWSSRPATSPRTTAAAPAPGPGGLLSRTAPSRSSPAPASVSSPPPARSIATPSRTSRTACWALGHAHGPAAPADGPAPLPRPAPASSWTAWTSSSTCHGLRHPRRPGQPAPRRRPGPRVLRHVLPRLNLGAEGYWELDTQAVSVEPNLSLRQMPRLDGWDADIEYYLISLAFSDTADNTPMAITIEQTRDVDAGVFVTPFVGAPFFINPGIGVAGVDRHVTWGVSDGFDGPHPRPSAASSPSESRPSAPKPLWRYVTPSLVTEFDVPSLPESAGNAAGLGPRPDVPQHLPVHRGW
ncbi:MAG: hypothetical protein R3F43_28425 [bacterium]